jgi:sulfur-oxidizing protein SoxA
VLLLGWPAGAADSRRSGFEDMGAATQAMQRDDGAEPRMLWVQEGEQLWARGPPRGAQSCAGCHGEAKSLRGVAARYPAWDEALRRPVDLATRINLCRERHQQQPAWRRSTANCWRWNLRGLQSRGLPIQPARIRACSLSSRAAKRSIASASAAGPVVRAVPRRALRAAPGAALIPQGMPPAIRSTGSNGSRWARWARVRGCMTGVRAEPSPRQRGDDGAGALPRAPGAWG